MQPKLNAELGASVDSSLLAALVNFLAALTVVTIGLVLRRRTRGTLRRLRSWSVPWWTLTAGLGGVVIVVAGAVAVETIGVATFSIAFFGGQITFGAVVDRAGLAPGGRRAVTSTRLQAALLAIAAVVVSQIGRPAGEVAPALVALVVAAGAALSFQSAFNGRIAAATGDAFAATAVNVMVGVAALGAIVGAVTATGHVDAPDWPTEPWLYAGGFLGVTVVVSMATAARALGVLRTTLVMLAAQLVAAFLVDWMVEHEAPTIGVIAGACLIVAAAALIGRDGRQGRDGRPGRNRRQGEV